jgi:hypothetical protein
VSVEADVHTAWPHRPLRRGTYGVLDLIPGVGPNGPVLVWLAEQFRQID